MGGRGSGDDATNLPQARITPYLAAIHHEFGPCSDISVIVLCYFCRITMRFLSAVILLWGVAAAENWTFALYPTLPIAVPESKDPLCSADSDLLIRSLKNETLWAVKMWDSSAKSPVGVLLGSTFQLGNFDECLGVLSPVRSQFCVVRVSAIIPKKNPPPADPYQLEGNPLENVWTEVKASRIDPSKIPRDVINWGLCVPASCSSSELQKGLNSYLKELKTSTSYAVEVKDEFCTAAEDPKDFTAGEIGFWLFTLLIVVLTVSSTTSDYLRKAQGSNLWMTFSARRNLAKLVSSSKELPKESHLDVLHGVKALSIFLIVFGHRMGISLSVSATNFQLVESHVRSESAMFFVHMDLIVDTFFFISGLLVCFFLTKIFSTGATSPGLAILTRILRLAPAYFFIVWYQATAANRLGSGPLWKAMAVGENRFCAENWWTNLLFINNYVNTKEMCMTHSWYIPCDFHFFVLAAALVNLIVKKRKIGLSVLSLLIVVSAIIPAVITYVYRIQPMIIFYHDFLRNPRDNDSFHILYIKSHNRATVYLIGMAVGFILYSCKDSVKRLSMKITLSASFVWLLLLLAPMGYGSLYYDVGRSYNAIEAAIFSSARRISWAIGFSIFVLVNRFGSIPVITKVLSSKPAFFLSNITYGIYLLHFNLISADVFKTRSPKPFGETQVFVDSLRDLLIAGFFAVVLSLTLELPLKKIVRDYLLVRRIQTPKMTKPQEMQQTNNNCPAVIDLTVHSVKL